MHLRRTLFTLGLSAVALCASLGLSASAQAATLTTGALIKGSGPAVYYFSAVSKRYVFPDLATYNSWYPDFSTVQTISDQDLAAIQIGGLITMRPGSRLVKIQTDPRVYAVTRGGRLRWVTTEALARGLFGSDWNRRVSDVSDAFFSSYSTGLDIDDVADFPEATEQMTAPSIEADLFTRRPPEITPPATTPPVTSAPTSSPATPAAPVASLSGRVEVLNSGPFTSGDTITVLASVTRGFPDRISVSFGPGTSASVCLTLPCRVEMALPNVTTSTSSTILTVQAVFEMSQGATTATPAVYSTSTAEVIVRPNQQSSLIHITAPPQVIYGSNRDLRIEVDNSLSVRTIEILLDGASIHSCELTQLCEYTQQENGTISQRRRVSAVVTDSEFRCIFSDSVTFEVVR